MHHLLPSECPAADTEPPRRPYATFSARSWHSGLKMTKDRNAVENQRFNRLKWLEKHERSAVGVPKRTVMSRFAEFSQVAYYNETRFSPPTPMFRDFQAISATSTSKFPPEHHGRAGIRQRALEAQFDLQEFSNAARPTDGLLHFRSSCLTYGTLTAAAKATSPPQRRMRKLRRRRPQDARRRANCRARRLPGTRRWHRPSHRCPWRRCWRQAHR